MTGKGLAVSKEISVPLVPTVAARTGSQRMLLQMGAVVAGSLLMAVCAHIVLPLFFTPVPLSLVTFAVMMIALLMPPRLAAATMVLYLAEGALGLPVFAPSALGDGGPAHLLGPTGGYLLSYSFATALVAFLYRRSGRGFWPAFCAQIAGSAVILLCGAAWFAIAMHTSFGTTLAGAVLPFLPGDAIKMTAAAGLATGYVRWQRRSIEQERTEE